MRVGVLVGWLVLAGPPMTGEAEAFAEASAVKEGESEHARSCAVRLEGLLREDGEGHPRGPEVLARAARCREIAGEFEEAARMREALVERYPQAPVARAELGALAHRYRVTAQFERAAAAMERFAQRYPDDERAAEFVLDAAQLRAGLGQESAALSLLARGEAHAQGSDPRRAAALFWARVELAPGTYADDQARRAHAEEYLQRYGAAGGLGRQILAEATIADVDWRRSCKQRDTPLDLCLTFKPAVPPARKGKPARRSCAGPEVRVAVVHPRDHKLAEAAQTRFETVLQLGEAWEREGEDDPQLRVQVREALDLAEIAVADRGLEAYLELRALTKLSLMVDARRRYTGDPRHEKSSAKQRHKSRDSPSRVYAFLQKKAAQERWLWSLYDEIVRREYSRRGLFAAAARLGVVLGAFADEWVTVEVPRALTSDTEIESYCSWLQSMAGTSVEDAKDVFADCLSRAARYPYSDAAVAFCADELERRYPREYPALHELFARGQSLPFEPEAVPVQLDPPKAEAVPGDM